MVSSVLKHFAGQRKESYVEIRFLNVIPKLFKSHDLILCRETGRGGEGSKETDLYLFAKESVFGPLSLTIDIWV